MLSDQEIRNIRETTDDYYQKYSHPEDPGPREDYPGIVDQLCRFVDDLLSDNEDLINQVENLETETDNIEADKAKEDYEKHGGIPWEEIKNQKVG